MSSTEQVNPDQPYDRLKELQEFDATKAGVKGLLDSGLTSTAIPRFFIQPPENRPEPKTNIKADLVIPTIDLSLPRSEVAAQLFSAAAETGFFQVTNHGIPVDTITRALDSVRAFHSLPVEERALYYQREPGTGFAYASNLDLYKSKAASWRDSLHVRVGSVPPGSLPDVARALVSEWDPEVVKLGEILMGLLCEGLGVETGRLKELGCLESRVMVAHYYPYCPQPDLTYGLTTHTDPGVITVLLQNEVAGLQVRYGDEWINVEPIENGLVINIGDILQIISNGKFKSVEHRVLANNQHEPRISIAAFFNTNNRECLFGPLPELITSEKPALYREFTLNDFMQRFFSKELKGETLANFYRI